VRFGRLATAVACVVALAFAVSANAATPPANFGLVSYGGDTWTNYDLTATNMQSVDWPVDLIFWGNASISKITSKIGWIWSGSTIYEQVNDGAGPVWVGSGGRKNTICTDTHYRLYADADGHLTTTPATLLGNYVIGTAHLDRNECFGPATFGFNEQAEATVAARARAAWGTSAVVEDAQFLPDGTPTFALLHNQVSYQEGNHYFDNDGYPTLIHVP
jgi:hypothetical protein